MKKRVLSLILVMCILSSLIITLPATASAATNGICGENLTWSLDNGTLTISGTGAMYNWYSSSSAPWYSSRLGITCVVIPDSVTTIGNYAFYGCTGLTSVAIPDSVTTIGNSAFSNCTGLTSVEIPDSVTTIGNFAFYFCTGLTSVVIGDSVTTIGNSAFSNCTGLTSVEIPDSVITIGNNAFNNCRGLTSIEIPDSVTTIGDYAFYNCTGLTSVVIGDSVTTIGNNAFRYCTGLTSVIVVDNNNNYCSKNGVLFNKDKTTLICYPAGKSDKSYIIPNSVTTIGDSAFYNCTKLTSVVIPDSVTTIGNLAFYFCTGLTSVVIGDSVTTIGNSAFYFCTDLTSVIVVDNNNNYCSKNGVLFNKDKTTLICYPAGKSDKSYIIPNSVTTIGDSAFYNCTKLTSVVIPDSVTTIGDSAFYICIGLTSVVIPDSVTTIGNSAFCFCRGLTSVVIGDSVTTIGYRAFYNCTNLANVYYSGSETDWNKIEIGSDNSCLTNATIHYNSTMLGYTSEYKEPAQKSGTFNFASGNKRTEEFYYEDNYFSGSAYTYNHDLAKMSMRLALSAFAKKTGSGANKDYSKQYINAYNLLDSCDFKNIEWNTDYEQQPWVNGMGVIAGNKKIAYDDGDYTLIAVALRGGGYEAEWGGNFNVGNSEYHDGFKTASSFVIQFIQDYIENNKINGNVKLWITGFSRAAATTNLTAAYFDEHPEWLHDDVNFIRDNLYAYCFETPAGVVAPYNESGIYNNIFSIVNQHDPVPMVAMRNWGFDRYGITKYLPTAQTNSNYSILKSRMVQNYNEYIGNNKAGISDDDKKPYKIDSFSKFSYIAGITGMHDYINAQGVYLEKTIDKLANAIGSTANYKDKYQDAFIYIGEELMGYKDTDAFVQRLRLEILARTAGKEAFGLVGDVFASNRKILKKSIESAFNYVGVDVEDEDVDVLLGLVVDLGFDDFITLLKNFGNLGQAHYPELCMAWLDAIDEEDFRDKRLRTLYLNCPVDIEVYDSNDNLVAAIYDNVPQEIDGSSIVAYVDENGQKVVYLPTDEEYRTEIIATDDGEVTYSVQEQNSDTGETRVINYNKMTVKKDDTLTGIAENLSETEVALYSLTSDSVTVEEPEIIENAVPVAITPVAEGNGNVSGGGSLLKGEYAQLVAMPFENENFLGWYNGETLVSSDVTYRFQVEEETTLTAKFTENTCEILYLTDDEDVVAIDRILKGSTVTFPSMTQNPNYMILDIYTDAEYTTLVDENTTYFEDAVLYAKVLTEDEWIQYDEVNNKVVVYSPTAMSRVRFMIALYEGEKLSELKPNTADLVVGKNEFDNPITNMGTASTMKIFVWNGLSTLKPLFKNCVVDLK